MKLNSKTQIHASNSKKDVEKKFKNIRDNENFYTILLFNIVILKKDFRHPDPPSQHNVPLEILSFE